MISFETTPGISNLKSPISNARFDFTPEMTASILQGSACQLWQFAGYYG
jgi:hypothetical protein